jgi:hypothetical protein
MAGTQAYTNVPQISLVDVVATSFACEGLELSPSSYITPNCINTKVPDYLLPTYTVTQPLNEWLTNNYSYCIPSGVTVSGASTPSAQTVFNYCSRNVCNGTYTGTNLYQCS